MAKDVEKFKELLNEFGLHYQFKNSKHRGNLAMKAQFEKSEQELIKMYSEAIKKLEQQKEELEYYGAREQDRYLQEPMEVE